MSVEQVLTSAVILAHDVNMSIFKPEWLLATGIFTDEEILEGFVITPAMVRIPTVRCELLVLPDRIQWRPSPDLNPTAQDALGTIGKIIEHLPHTPYESIGLNFEFLTSPPEGAEFEEWARELMISDLSAKLGGEDTGNRFGTILTTRALDFALQIDARTVRIDNTSAEHELEFPAGSEAIRLKFNYHQSLQGDNRSQDILVALGKLEGALAHSEGLLQDVFGE